MEHFRAMLISYLQLLGPHSSAHASYRNTQLFRIVVTCQAQHRLRIASGPTLAKPNFIFFFPLNQKDFTILPRQPTTEQIQLLSSQILPKLLTARGLQSKIIPLIETCFLTKGRLGASIFQEYFEGFQSILIILKISRYFE